MHKKDTSLQDFYGINEPVPFCPRSATDRPDGDWKSLGFTAYNPDEIVLGKPLAEHLRFAVCYWHTFCWDGRDTFGMPTFQRPWMEANEEPIEESMRQAKRKADFAFELFRLLRVPFFTFHDRDIAPEGDRLAASNRNVSEMAEVFSRKMEQTGVKLLWGTANLFSHPRYMAGAATNPDPEVFAYAAAQVKHCLDITHSLGGENYVLWGGREGYETLLNTDLKRELHQLGRFLCMVVEHKHRINFRGQILIEPKPQEPTKHQYDFDVAGVYGFLQSYGLEKEVRVNIEQNHAIMAGHSFEHEIALAIALGIFGSLDINRGDYQSGWDTDQFPNNVPELTLAFYELLKGGGGGIESIGDASVKSGLGQGGLNFDAKLRRQSTDPADLLLAHIGGMDACAKAFKAAAAMLEAKMPAKQTGERYAGWDLPENLRMLKQDSTLEEISQRVLTKDEQPAPKSGHQEALENLVNRFIWQD